MASWAKKLFGGASKVSTGAGKGTKGSSKLPIRLVIAPAEPAEEEERKPSAAAESASGASASASSSSERITVSPSLSHDQELDADGKVIMKDEALLDFDIPAFHGQSGLRSFGYYYTSDGRCRSIEGDNPVGRFPTQKAYEEFGSTLERFIFHLLRTHYQFTELRFMQGDRIVSDARVFVSPDYHLKETVLYLVPGSGAVRSSQWARSICINNSLADGTAFPFIQSAYRRGWGVVLCDPNARWEGAGYYAAENVTVTFEKAIYDVIVGSDSQQSVTDDDAISADASADDQSGDVTMADVSADASDAPSAGDSAMSEEAAVSVPAEEVTASADEPTAKVDDPPASSSSSSSVSKSAKGTSGIQTVLIVAHSAGGWCTSNLLKKFGKFSVQRDLIKGVAFTDCGTPSKSFCSAEQRHVYGKYGRNYITSTKPLGTPIRNSGAMPELSAGNQRHEWTSASAYTEIFKFFDRNIGLDVCYVEPSVKGAEEESSAARMRPGKTKASVASSETETPTKKRKVQAKVDESEAVVPVGDPDVEMAGAEDAQATAESSKTDASASADGAGSEPTVESSDMSVKDTSKED